MVILSHQFCSLILGSVGDSFGTLYMRQQSGWPEHWISGLADVQKELHRWESADSVAQAWAYSVSHSQMLVRIYRQQGTGSPSPTSLYLYLKDCHRVSFHDLWRDIRVRVEEQRGKYGPEFIVTDGDRLFVHCGVRPFAAESPVFLRFETPSI